MQGDTGVQAGSVQTGMAVYGSDGQRLGTVERVGDGAIFLAGRKVTLESIERVEAGEVHLWGDSATYAEFDAQDEDVVSRERSKGLPNTDAPLQVNAHDVEASLEERLPRDGQR